MRRPTLIALALAALSGAGILLMQTRPVPVVRANTIPYPQASLYRQHPPVTGMPEYVDVNGVMFRIEVREDVIAGLFAGYTECDRKVIEISSFGTNDVRQILMHELMHASVCRLTGTKGWTVDNMYFNSSTPARHESFDRFTRTFREILIRNPGLGDYLAEVN
jgi:hypothetical protein